MSLLLRTAVQNTLINLAKAGEFYEILYNSDNEAIPYEAGISQIVVPSSVLCNETDSAFEHDKNFGRSFRLKRSNWLFLLLVEFNNKEVMLTKFEDSLCEKPPFIAKTASDKSALIVLVGTAVEHPVTQQSSSGTVAKFSFSVELGRN